MPVGIRLRPGAAGTGGIIETPVAIRGTPGAGGTRRGLGTRTGGIGGSGRTAAEGRGGG